MTDAELALIELIALAALEAVERGEYDESPAEAEARTEEAA